MTSPLKRNLRTGGVFALILCITVAMAIVGVRRIQLANQALVQFSSGEVDRQVLVERLSFETRLNMMRTTTALRSPDSKSNTQLFSEIQGATRSIDTLTARLAALIHETSGRQWLAAIGEAKQAYRVRRDLLTERRRAGEDVSDRIEVELEPLVLAYLQAQQSLNTYLDGQLADSQKTAARAAKDAEWGLTLGALLAVTLGLALAVVWIRAERHQRRAARHLRHMAHHDVLTGLPNRTVLSSELKRAIAAARVDGRHVAVAFIDLDGFKGVNDTFGHMVGDELLKILSARIAGSIRSADTAVRLGGDEFAIVFDDPSHDGAGIALPLARIVSQVAQVAAVGGIDIHSTCSIGVATFPQDGDADDILLKNADAAMYEAKAAGGNRVEHYRREMNAQAADRYRLQAALGTAAGNGEFFLLYQPQVDMASGRMTGVEALLRWRHPQLGVLLPSQFIALAEQTGLIVEIGDWALRAACAQNVTWQAMGLPRLRMAVNVSARQFRSPDFPQRVAKFLAETGHRPADLELELTESMLMHDVDTAVSLMRGLTAHGIGLSIDDFGTGYSSLGALKTFPISRLKIDRAFVTSLATDEQDQAIASAVIMLAHRLHLAVVAEGIETVAQLDFLRKHHCDEMQGYLFSRPVEPGEIPRLVNMSHGPSRRNDRVGALVERLSRELTMPAPL